MPTEPGFAASLSPYGPEFGYTLATGRLFCDFGLFQEWASDMIGRPLMTHEFADKAVWDELREAFEQEVIEHAAV